MRSGTYFGCARTAAGSRHCTTRRQQGQREETKESRVWGSVWILIVHVGTNVSLRKAAMDRHLHAASGALVAMVKFLVDPTIPDVRR